MVPGVEIGKALTADEEKILSPPALAFIAHLHRMFEETRRSLLRARADRDLFVEDEGKIPDFAPETSSVRDGKWQVAPPPAVIGGGGIVIPANLVAAAPGGLAVASFEDAISPSWHNILASGLALAKEAPRQEGAIFCCPRGWHLPEAHLLVDGAEVAGAIVDFALHFFSSGGAGGHSLFALPKLEHHLEARLWNNLFIMAQSILGLPLGSIRAMAIIETLQAAFQAEEILYELRDHAIGLAFDRSDYLFSYLKNFRDDAARQLPDGDDDAATPFVAAAAGHVAAVCKRRGALAVGDIRPFLPGAAAARHAPQHPPATADGAALAAFPEGRKTVAGMARDVFTAIGYLAGWLSGEGLAAIGGKAVDTAAAELCRARLWGWRRHGAILDDGSVVSGRRLNSEIKNQLSLWRDTVGDEAYQGGKYREAATILLDLLLADELPDFFTLPCYRRFHAS